MILTPVRAVGSAADHGLTGSRLILNSRGHVPLVLARHAWIMLSMLGRPGCPPRRGSRSVVNDQLHPGLIR
jgi:hypothetical protein